MMCANRHYFSGSYCHTCGTTPEKKKPKRIKKQSDKLKNNLDLYYHLIPTILEMRPICEVDQCNNQSVELHHISGREGSKLVDLTNLLAVCRECHTRIELQPIWAKVMGYSKSRLC